MLMRSFNGSELTEDHKEKIQLVFEAAVVAKVNEEIAKFAVAVESDAEATNIQIVEELTEKVDSYLDYVVQEWVEENALAIEKGVRADMVEDFMVGSKESFHRALC
jgi:DNA integrity scanning protein DisA with diadenylate cyclase activity